MSNVIQINFLSYVSNKHIYAYIYKGKNINKDRDKKTKLAGGNKLLLNSVKK